MPLTYDCFSYGQLVNMRPAAGAQAEVGILGAYDPFKQSWCVWYVNSLLLECDLLHIAAADLSAHGESSANDKVHNTSCSGCLAKLEKRPGRHPRCICLEKDTPDPDAHNA